MKKLVIGYFLGVFTVLLTWQTTEYFVRKEAQANRDKAIDTVNRIEHCKLQWFKNFAISPEGMKHAEERVPREAEKYKERNYKMANAMCKDLAWNGMIYEEGKWFSLPKK